jgi:Cu(I)/Ag(I) efflux system membrane fusion protein
MKTKALLMFISFTVLILTFSACSSSKNKSTDTNGSSSTKVIYTCPMHPEIRSDKEGKCPKCGMDLIKVEKASDTTIVKN